MHDPLIPIFLTVIGAYIIGTEFQYPDNILGSNNLMIDP